jgi:hypothetical protein
MGAFRCIHFLPHGLFPFCQCFMRMCQNDAVILSKLSSERGVCGLNSEAVNGPVFFSCDSRKKVQILLSFNLPQHFLMYASTTRICLVNRTRPHTLQLLLFPLRRSQALSCRKCCDDELSLYKADEIGWSNVVLLQTGVGFLFLSPHPEKIYRKSWSSG